MAQASRAATCSPRRKSSFSRPPVAATLAWHRGSRLAVDQRSPAPDLGWAAVGEGVTGLDRGPKGPLQRSTASRSNADDHNRPRWTANHHWPAAQQPAAQSGTRCSGTFAVPERQHTSSSVCDRSPMEHIELSCMPKSRLAISSPRPLLTTIYCPRCRWRTRCRFRTSKLRRRRGAAILPSSPPIPPAGRRVAGGRSRILPPCRQGQGVEGLTQIGLGLLFEGVWVGCNQLLHRISWASDIVEAQKRYMDTCTVFFPWRSVPPLPKPRDVAVNPGPILFAHHPPTTGRTRTSSQPTETRSGWISSPCCHYQHLPHPHQDRPLYMYLLPGRQAGEMDPERDTGMYNIHVQSRQRYAAQWPCVHG